ncbi:hypothetical protein [Bradyrhizobium sp. LB12.1]|jgi:hypothetical protein|uniref:hypothetical protein n=1 Tax=Bradyrhizobium sp. LB12.1 TaxID=3156327 RepID=UPI0033978E88
MSSALDGVAIIRMLTTSKYLPRGLWRTGSVKAIAATPSSIGTKSDVMTEVLAFRKRDSTASTISQADVKNENFVSVIG